VVSVFMSSQVQPRELGEAGIPSFSFPEAAARALGRVARYARWRRRPLGSPVEPDGLQREAARNEVDRFLAAPGGDDTGARWLESEDAASILRAYGVPLATAEVVSTAEEGAEVQRALGRPVAVKLATAIHKADVGGVVLGLDSPDAVAAAIDDLRERLRAQDLEQHAQNFLVQEMIDEGIEMVVGVTHDPSFGPIVLTGAGGTLVELLRDVSVRITPLTDHDVDDMLDQLRMAPLLRGYRGAPPADAAALKDLLHRINAMVEDLPEVVELDLNPVFVRPDGQGVVAADVRMKLAPVSG
jgi:acetate---CoA ligase (ADP-forming)